MLKRSIEEIVKEDLVKKMVFVGGPRQVGKTTMALNILKAKNIHHPAYINWDYLSNKEDLLRGQLPPQQKLIILDEIHKYKHWRNLLKGLYDKNKNLISFLITGSARLDYYNRGGDSLLGRYHYHRLHPITLDELSLQGGRANDLQQLLQLGGFPEPFFSGTARNHRRWIKERSERVISEDLRDLESVREVGLLRLLISMLPKRVASTLSINSLKEDLGVAHETVSHWMNILENIYYCYRIYPFTNATERSLKKEAKLYLWDWSECLDEGARFENLVASHLLKFCHNREDQHGYRMSLNYLRDREGREVDFIITQDDLPLFAVECKLNDTSFAKNLEYFQKRTNIPRLFQVHLGAKEYLHNETGTNVIHFKNFVDEINSIKA